MLIKHIRDNLSCCNFGQVQTLIRLGIIVLVILDINEKLSSTTFLKQSHQWQFQCFYISCWNFMDLKIKINSFIFSLNNNIFCSRFYITQMCSTFPLLYTKVPSTDLKLRHLVTYVCIRIRTKPSLAIINQNNKLKKKNNVNTYCMLSVNNEIIKFHTSYLRYHVNIVLLTCTQALRRLVAPSETLP